uniref:Theileria-specific sub-telomeric protein, putative n=1 Tax=Theileria annulata TaxID=5874 RepID=A0A3B0MYI9_THEAN
MPNKCPVCTKPANENYNGDCTYLICAYILAGLAMMLNIRLSYSSAPYALIRFGLPENLFSVFVRRIASALELWCLPSMLLGNIMDLGVKGNFQGDGSSPPKPTEGDRLNRFNWIIIPSIVAQWLNFLTYVLLLFVYLMGGGTGHLTTFYFVIAISGFVFGINMTLLYAADYNYTPVYIAGENSFPIVTSLMHYLTTLMFGNRRKWNSDYIVVCVDIVVAIIISFAAAVMWSVAYGHYRDTKTSASNTDTVTYGHILTEGFDKSPVHWGAIISPALMVIVGMGLVYSIYPGIAPGMIVPFYLIDKIEMVLLIATFFPPVIVAMLIRYLKEYSPKTQHTGGDGGFTGWTTAGPVFYHAFDILLIIKISLAIIFIYSLHYRDSNLSRSIINQPKMSTTLSITFYMCHEILLALGFAGVIGNNGGTYVVLPAQYIGALFMIFLAFYSEGYIIEYKSHDPAHWPTEGMWYYF